MWALLFCVTRASMVDQGYRTLFTVAYFFIESVGSLQPLNKHDNMISPMFSSIAEETMGDN